MRKFGRLIINDDGSRSKVEPVFCEKDDGLHINILGKDCLIRRIVDKGPLNSSHDYKRKNRKRSFISKMKIKLFGPSAKELFEGA